MLMITTVKKDALDDAVNDRTAITRPTTRNLCNGERSAICEETGHQLFLFVAALDES